MFSPDDTIVALATPPGRGGLSVVRLSGPRSLEIASRLIDSPAALEPRRATLARVATAVRPAGTAAATPAIAQAPGAAVDQAVVTWFRAPASYTGEDVVEFSLHGSPVIAGGVIAACTAAGARLAGPGEFTLRAFLNGRLDLTQAEAVRDLVEATTPLQAKVAFDQLQGALAERIGEIERQLFDLTTRLEASADFGEEGYHFISPEETREAIRAALSRIEGLLAESRRGRLVREGIVVAIAGRPNVGKSTLFNRLSGVDRAIVTPVPGTTRDLLTEAVMLGATRVTLVDTAGLRPTSDPAEREGVARAERAQAAADIVLVVLDRSAPLTADDRRLLRAGERAARIVVANKADLPAAWTPSELMDQGLADEAAPVVEISAVAGTGVDELILSIDRAAGLVGPQEPIYISNIRHIELLGRSAELLRDADSAAAFDVGQMPEEMLLSDIGAASSFLQEVTGQRTTDDLLAAIFSRFCIGK
jgi:tRNA modification GTPase